MFSPFKLTTSSIILAPLFLSNIGQATSWEVGYQPYQNKGFFRTASLEAEGPLQGQILYLPGFADRFENHNYLWQRFREAGYRVITLDYPSHGDSVETIEPLNQFKISDLRNMAALALDAYKIDLLPTHIVAWSTGAVVALNGLKPIKGDYEFSSAKAHFLGHEISSLVQIAPAVAPKPLVGELGVVTEQSLSSLDNPPYLGEPSPNSHLKHPLFALDLILQSGKTWLQKLPDSFPMLTFTAGKRLDKYVFTEKVHSWVKQKQKTMENLSLMYCPKSKHDLTNEPDGVRELIISTTFQFLEGESPKETKHDSSCFLITL